MLEQQQHIYLFLSFLCFIMQIIHNYFKNDREKRINFRKPSKSFISQSCISEKYIEFVYKRMKYPMRNLTFQTAFLLTSKNLQTPYVYFPCKLFVILGFHLLLLTGGNLSSTELQVIKSAGRLWLYQFSQICFVFHLSLLRPNAHAREFFFTYY